MAYFSQIAFEIRARKGAREDVFDQLLGIHLLEYADDEALDPEVREELVFLLQGAVRTKVEGVPVMRYFDPCYRTAVETDDALMALEGFVTGVDRPGSGFSGGYIRIGEEHEVEHGFWAADDDGGDAVREALQWITVLLPGWTSYGVHLSGREVRDPLEGPIRDEDIRRICDAAMPGIRALLKEKAEELGYRCRHALAV